MDGVAQKVDYAELRRIYFNYQSESVPSHSNNQSEDEKYLADHSNSKIHNLIKITSDSEETMEVSQWEQALANGDFYELDELKSRLSKQANEILNQLFAKYGSEVYEKLIQLIKDKGITNWSQLESEMLSANFEILIAEGKRFTLQEKNGFEKSSQPDDDLDYLDALVQQDYRRLNKLQSNNGCISSIFGEIVENEQHSNSNYKDDVFEKNIDLILNSDIDLDSSEWLASDVKQNLNIEDRQNRGFLSSGQSLNTLNMTSQLNVHSELSQEVAEGVASLKAATQIDRTFNAEKVVIRKVVPKQLTKERVNIGFNIMLLLTFILTGAVVMLALMILI